VISCVELQASLPTVHYLLRGMQLNGLSQANIYGDDCNPSTNYPLVRLRNISTGQVLFARTFDFSTRGVATGASLQSVRFSAAHIPYGHYEPCVIANGISSHCISFGHHHPRCCCEQCYRQKSECCCPVHKAPFCDEEKAVIEPEIVALRSEIHRLSRSVNRFASHIEVEEPHREPKEVKRSEKSQRVQHSDRKRGPRKRPTKRSS
jgi:hypothetical protein